MKSPPDPAVLLSLEEKVLIHKLTTVRLTLWKRRIKGCRCCWTVSALLYACIIQQNPGWWSAKTNESGKSQTLYQPFLLSLQRPVAHVGTTRCWQGRGETWSGSSRTDTLPQGSFTPTCEQLVVAHVQRSDITQVSRVLCVIELQMQRKCNFKPLKLGVWHINSAWSFGVPVPLCWSWRLSLHLDLDEMSPSCLGRTMKPNYSVASLSCTTSDRSCVQQVGVDIQVSTQDLITYSTYTLITKHGFLYGLHG